MADALITVAGVTVTAGVRSNTIRWTVNLASCLPYLALAVFEVWSAATNDRASATKIGDTTDLSFTHQGLLIGVPRYYWVRAKDTSGQYSDFFPLSATSGISGTPTSTGTDSVGSDELQDNSVGGNHLKADSVTADKIDVDELSAISATLGDVAINGNLLINGTVSSGKYANLSVLTAKIADGAVTDPIVDKITSGSFKMPDAAGTWKTLLSIVVPSGNYTYPVGAYLHFRTPSGTTSWDLRYRLQIVISGAGVDLDTAATDDSGEAETYRIPLIGIIPPMAPGNYTIRVQMLAGFNGNDLNFPITRLVLATGEVLK